MAVPHLITTHYLSVEEITTLLDDAASVLIPGGLGNRRFNELNGKRLVLAFFEPSTRTRLSFETAAERLGASSIFFQTSGSSVEKGETMRETIFTIQSMGFDAIIIRHASNGIMSDIASYSTMSVINAGEGSASHPTQALLDASTIRERRGSLTGCRVAIVGDLRHSRVARSTSDVLLRMGADVRFCAPDALVPIDQQFSTMQRMEAMDDVLQWADVVYLLRIQRERISDQIIPDAAEYRHMYAITLDRAMKHPNVVIMHPGPVNVGVEIDEPVLDLPNCLIHRQVAHGVAVRMAVLRKIFSS